MRSEPSTPTEALGERRDQAARRWEPAPGVLCSRVKRAGPDRGDRDSRMSF
jgi:hypothetical protein